jgi:hypothetical protein
VITCACPSTKELKGRIVCGLIFLGALAYASFNIHWCWWKLRTYKARLVHSDYYTDPLPSIAFMVIHLTGVMLVTLKSSEATLNFCYFILLFLPTVLIQVRRNVTRHAMHDTGLLEPELPGFF